MPPLCFVSKTFFSMATTVLVVIRSYFAFSTSYAALPSWAFACLTTVIGSSAHVAMIEDHSLARSSSYFSIRFLFSDTDSALVSSAKSGIAE